MRIHLIVLALLITLLACNKAKDSQEKLDAHVRAIEQEEVYDNSVVLDDEAGDAPEFPKWQERVDYYQDDLVQGEDGINFRAVRDNTGSKPSATSEVWSVFTFPAHPYVYLRDTAEVDDLKALVTHRNAAVKVYAFAALAKRNEEGLFSIILDNLPGTTSLKMTPVDTGHAVHPADLMISYQLKSLSKEQRAELADLIDTKYRHLNDTRKVLGETVK